MSSLSGKKFVLGVTASIAAYKSAVLVRLLVKAGAQVKVVMTPAARDFITPLTLATLSRNPVQSDFVAGPSGIWNSHVELGLWADAFVVAPASANTLAKMANGLCDNLLLATYLSARCPVFLAPAMDLDMLKHPSTTRNLSTLRGFGNHIIDSTFGELASGLVGDGRMAEPEELLHHLELHFGNAQKLAGKKVLITSGPTYEAIDPVRFIGNHSTGKMGFALAEAAARQGAQVTLISGPTQQHTEQPGISVIPVTSADDMYHACQEHFANTDIAILAAAVADYKPAEVATTKIKKSVQDITLVLTKTQDIAASLGKVKKNGQLLVGFALETDNEEANARQKLEAKNFDLIVLNSLRDPGAGFGHDTNKVRLIDRTGSREFELKSKKEVAHDIIQAIIEKLHH